VKLLKENFLAWADDNHWLKVDEQANTNGRMDLYMTPSGNMAAAVYNIAGELQQVQPVVLIPPTPMRIPPNIDLGGGGKRFPH